MEDHYFGTLKPRVSAYMHDLDEELWKLGIPAKTKLTKWRLAARACSRLRHTNVAVDHNQLTMEIMKKVADKHNMVCLLNEKPFEGINGSGKHNNWSMITDTGVNLLDPGQNSGGEHTVPGIPGRRHQSGGRLRGSSPYLRGKRRKRPPAGSQ